MSNNQVEEHKETPEETTARYVQLAQETGLVHISLALKELNLPLKKKKADIWRYLFAGNATFTIESTKVNQRYTYKIYQRKNENICSRYLIYRLYGPDNENDYRYIGLIYNDTGNITWASAHKGMDLKMLSAFLQIVKDPEQPWPDTCHFYMSGRCACCGRKLTTPESVELGIGPTCLKYIDD